ncbi:MAG: MGMT family protein [Patescibacteria group bacterium]|jgi:O-6-methylguanine DNA methyltransferase|nr:MGMT family protein [Patescibacteria group bacterium]
MPTDFANQILKLVAQIPPGQVTTYRILAVASGHHHSARAVGNALNKNPELIKIPCHRVVRSDGLVGNYRLGRTEKIKLLQAEGIESSNGRIKDFYQHLFYFK